MQNLTVGQQIQFPQLEAPPEDFVEQMEDYVKGATSRTITRRFPSILSRNARGGPSPAISGRGSEVMRRQSKTSEEIEEGIQSDFLNLDVNDSVVSPRGNNSPVIIQNPVPAPFTDPVLGTQNPANTGPVFGAKNPVLEDPVFSTQNPANTGPVFGAQSPVLEDSVFSTQNSINTGPVFGEQSFLDEWTQPSGVLSSLPDRTVSYQDHSMTPFDDVFGARVLSHPPPSRSSRNLQSGNPFDDAGLDFSPQQDPLQSPSPQKLQYQYSTGRHTGPGAMTDPFHGLNPSIQPKTSLANPGVPMRSESRDFANTSTHGTTTHQQDYPSFFF